MIRLLLKLITKILFRVRVRGEFPEQLPERLLIVSNHQSFLDPYILGAWLPVYPTWVVHTEVWAKWYFRLLVRWQPCVVVDTTKPQALKKLIKEIEKGKPVVLFPEGRLTLTGSLMKLYDGTAFLAAKTGAAVWPVSIDGAIYTPFSRMKAPFPRRWFPRITLTFSPPAYIPMPQARTGKQRRRIATRQLRRLLEQARYATRPRTTLTKAFLDAAALYGKKTEIVDDIRREGQTYSDLLKASLGLGRLVSRLAGPGEVVGVLLPNAGVTLAALLGMIATRRVPALLNYSAGVEGMQTGCTAARIRTILTSREFLKKARLTEKVSRLRGVRLVFLEELRSRFGIGDKLWLMGWARWFPRKMLARCRPQDPAVVLFTSGSEGKPKGVVLSHDAILANIAQIKAVIEFSNKDKFLTALPMFHAFGLTAGTLMPLLTGCRVFLYPSPLHYRMIPEMVYDRNCTVLFGTPAFLAKYGMAASPYDFFQTRYVVAGAEKLSDEVRRLWMEKFGIRILEGYGATECAPVLSVNTPFAYRAGSVGRLLPGIEHQVVPVAGIPEGGSLHVRGDNLMLGYYRDGNPGVLEPPRSSAGPGWYDTGDVVDIDEAGFVHITGRLRRFAKVAGEMVSLEMAEKIAAAASPNHLSAASTKASASRGEAIVLFTQDAGLRRSRLMAAAQNLGLPELAVARRVEYVERLPLLGSGKIDYVKLKQMAGALP